MSSINNGIKQNNIKDKTIPLISKELYENIFNVNVINNESRDSTHYFYNTLNKVSLPANLDSSVYDKVNINYDTPWTSLSYNIYNTINLWWLLVLVNKPDYIFMAKGGKEYTIIKPAAVDQILLQINEK